MTSRSAAGFLCQPCPNMHRVIRVQTCACVNRAFSHSPIAPSFAAVVHHLHGWEGGRNFGRLLSCNCGGWSTNCTLGECLRANDGLAWGWGDKGRARIQSFNHESVSTWMPKVEKSLMYLQVEEKLEEYAITDLYYVCIAKMDPSKMNEPVTRRRLYILLIRKTLSCTCG